jgi:cupin 2 domain-containing protein
VLTLLKSGNLRIERIVSNGQASPDGFWYDQEQHEWVVILKGTASLKFDSGEGVDLTAGDHLLIESHARHRVEKVSADAIWLGVHYAE